MAAEGPILSVPVSVHETSSRDTILPRDATRDVTRRRDVTTPTKEYPIRCSPDTADLWHQYKCDLNFSDCSDEDFLLFLLYTTVRGLSEDFSGTLVLPPPCPDLSSALKSQPTKLLESTHVTSSKPDRSTPGHECRRCKKTFRNKYYLNRHQKRSCNEVNPLKVYHCQHCTAVVTSMTSLRAHIAQKHREIRYNCDQCNKTFKNADYVKQHVRVAHNNIKDHKCAECGKEFTQHGSLQLHIRMVHQKLRNFMCRLCQQTFGCKSHLTRHIRKQHNDAKQMVCDICDTVFDQEADLKSHIKTMHYQTEFICNVCNKAFKLKHTLAKHIAKCHTGSETGSDSKPSSCSFP